MSGDDPIDRLLWITGGEVLRVGHEVTGGEYDSYRGGALSTRTLRRLAGAGLVSRRGVEADVLVEIAAARYPLAAMMTPDEFVAWWVRESVAGLDWRADRRNRVAWELQERPDPVRRGRPAGRYVGRVA